MIHGAPRSYPMTDSIFALILGPFITKFAKFRTFCLGFGLVLSRTMTDDQRDQVGRCGTGLRISAVTTYIRDMLRLRQLLLARPIP